MASLIPVDEDGWRGRGLKFLTYPGTGDVKGYRFLIPPAPGVPPAADANIARDTTGAVLKDSQGRLQLDLQTERYSPHSALLALLTG